MERVHVDAPTIEMVALVERLCAALKIDAGLDGGPTTRGERGISVMKSGAR
jgi:hypothetical protein